MGKTYRSLQQWNKWLMDAKGQTILQAEKQALQQFPDTLTRGKHGVLIGVPGQMPLLREGGLMYRTLVSPIRGVPSEDFIVRGDPNDLPIASGSTDLVILPHTLEYTVRPHHLLAEACRIVRPQGHIIVIGFNPLGWWGIRNRLLRDATFPAQASFHAAHRIKHWLAIADFALVSQAPFRAFGSIYALLAEARVTPCTPIRLRWKQKLPAFHPTLVGPTIRNQV